MAQSEFDQSASDTHRLAAYVGWDDIFSLLRKMYVTVLLRTKTNFSFVEVMSSFWGQLKKEHLLRPSLCPFPFSHFFILGAKYRISISFLDSWHYSLVVRHSREAHFQGRGLIHQIDYYSIYQDWWDKETPSHQGKTAHYDPPCGSFLKQSESSGCIHSNCYLPQTVL